MTDAPADTRRLRLDTSYRRPLDGSVVIGGSPLRVLTLSAGGVDVMRNIERDGRPAVPTSGAASLVERLLDLGIVHPVHDVGLRPTRDGSDGATSLTIVTPLHRGGSSAARDGIALLPPWTSPAIVVDDASVPPVRPHELEPNAQIVRLDLNVGPGGARNAGLALVDTRFVAFVDADVEIDEGALLALLDWFDDAKVALVAPRIVAIPGADRLARFEADRSPLDLGTQPARVAPTTRVSYVPAAVIVCRTEAVRAVGGFDDSLRWGEDVDLVWRLHEAGWRCRYEPSVTAGHRTRASVRAWVTQRYRYGTSAAPLAERHPGALAPVRMSGWSAATWAAVAAGMPIVGVAIGVGTTVALVRKLRQVPAAEAVRLAGLGNLFAGRLLATTLTRAWWPLAAAAAVLSRRARRALLAAVVVPILLDRRTDTSSGAAPEAASGAADDESATVARVDPLTYATLHVLDDLAYGAGVWAGAWRERSGAALLPSFESWPPRHRRSD
jgi:mycofactocin glycosyltransferase